jgi:hypothetical protein
MGEMAFGAPRFKGWPKLFLKKDSQGFRGKIPAAQDLGVR